MAEETVNTDEKIIDDAEDKSKDSVEDKKVDIEESVDSTEEEKEEEEKEEEEEDVDIHLRPTYKEITGKYPNLFKDFPDLRHAFFSEQKYRDIFTTVEEAEETKQQFESIRGLHEKFLSGSVEGISEAMSDIKSADITALDDIASNFLTALYKVSPEHYNNATTPILESLVRTVFREAESKNDENLKNSALLISQYLFGDEDVASGKKTFTKRKDENKPDKERTKFEEERKSFRAQQFNTLNREVSDTIKDRLLSDISKGISLVDNGLKEILTEKILSEVDRVLVGDKSHLDTMDRLWMKASDNGFSREWKDKIVSAYLARARTIMPSIRAKIVGKISSISSKTDGQLNKEVSQSGSSKGTKSVKAELGKVDYSKSSDEDIIDGKVVVKK